MDVAELVLEYVKALAWPVVVGGAIFLFRHQIAAKIKNLTGVTTPLGDAKFDAEAKEIEAKADRAAARQDLQPAPPGPGVAGPGVAGAGVAGAGVADDKSPDDGEGPDDGGDSGPGPSAQPSTPTGTPPTPAEAAKDADAALRAATEAVRRSNDARAAAAAKRERDLLAVAVAVEELGRRPDFGTARDIAVASPNAAIMLAYTEMEKVARAAKTITSLEPASPRLSTPVIIGSLTKTGLDAEFAQVARDLAELRNRVTHGAGNVSITGALDFIAACERLTEALVGNATSKLRHPSRSAVLRELVDLFDQQPTAAHPSDPMPVGDGEKGRQPVTGLHDGRPNP